MSISGLSFNHDKLLKSAYQSNRNPLEAARLQMEAVTEAKANAKVVQAKNEALGTVIDLYA